MPRLIRSIAALAVLVTSLSAVHAQTVYRIVGPDGRVTFSDQPPPAAAPVKGVAPVARAGAPAASAGTALPFELRQVVARYPVTLFTGPNCSPCASGRSMLSGRGIPFTEKTVSTNEDIDALQRMSGDSSLPFLMIGSQQLRGYSDSEWAQFLDAAGYPKTSQLPSGYANPAPVPLVAAKRPDTAPAPAPAAAAPAAPEVPALPLPIPAGSNPNAIRF